VPPEVQFDSMPSSSLNAINVEEQYSSAVSEAAPVSSQNRLHSFWSKFNYTQTSPAKRKRGRPSNKGKERATYQDKREPGFLPADNSEIPGSPTKKQRRETGFRPITPTPNTSQENTVHGLVTSLQSTSPRENSLVSAVRTQFDFDFPPYDDMGGLIAAPVPTQSMRPTASSQPVQPVIRSPLIPWAASSQPPSGLNRSEPQQYATNFQPAKVGDELLPGVGDDGWTDTDNHGMSAHGAGA
jgi:hypothetical protein